MASLNFYFQLIIRVLLITVSALGSAYFIVTQWYSLGVALLLSIGFQTYVLITYINKTNRKIAYFFDAIRNEDFTLRFPEKVSIQSFKELNSSLNRVNQLIQDVQLQLQARERYYQEILKQIDIGIMTIDEKGHILFSNPFLEKLLNFRPLLHVKQLQQIDQKLFELIENLGPFEQKYYQLVNEREKNQLFFKAVPIQMEGKALLLVTVQDLHKELDEKETDSWVRLIRVLTHEIMNTITPITSISESLSNYYKIDETGELRWENLNEDQIKNTVKGLNVIRIQGEDLMDFVKSYRSFLDLPSPDKSLVQIKSLLDRLKVLMRMENSKQKVLINLLVEPEDLEFFLDEKQIAQVLINLSKNAIQSMQAKEDGILTIKAAINAQGRKYIEVKDNGPGIPADQIDEIFVPFFTTKEGGTGIGLSLSKQIMHLHGGSIRVHSTPGKETSFVLTF
ncbi:sensor histidine kinase [Cyclobacterium amurskyense]|uniref:histidine kinase n=1 Tax=Cyclobacterium amurskyense TaxID=320787 RepID=A0A0H4PYF9_9BACT|nr:ATP-binding protein [Cyclobacterium amurskyense]AKP53452.1 Multi-sensor signal transduction histidine kinase [Cyclobacterium amurskyense]